MQFVIRNNFSTMLPRPLKELAEIYYPPWKHSATLSQHVPSRSGTYRKRTWQSIIVQRFATTWNGQRAEKKERDSYPTHSTTRTLFDELKFFGYITYLCYISPFFTSFLHLLFSSTFLFLVLLHIFFLNFSYIFHSILSYKSSRNK